MAGIQRPKRPYRAFNPDNYDLPGSHWKGNNMLRAIIGIANRSYKINLIGLGEMVSYGELHDICSVLIPKCSTGGIKRGEKKALVLRLKERLDRFEKQAKIERERAEHRANLERILEREWEDVMATIFDIDIGTAVVAIGKDAEQTQIAGRVVNQATSNLDGRLYQVEVDDSIRVWIPEERVKAWDYDPISEQWAADDALNVMQYPLDEPIELTKAMMI